MPGAKMGCSGRPAQAPAPALFVPCCTDQNSRQQHWTSTLTTVTAAKGGARPRSERSRQGYRAKPCRTCVPSCDASSARLLVVAASTEEVRRTSAAAISSAVLCGPFAVSSCRHAFG